MAALADAEPAEGQISAVAIEEAERVRLRRRNDSRQQNNSTRGRRNLQNLVTPRQHLSPIGTRCNMDTVDTWTHFIRRVQYYDVGPLSTECFYCHALGFKDENRGTATTPHFGTMCCRQGNVRFQLMDEVTPTVLDELLNAQNSRAEYFRRNIRKFNASLALASLQVNNKTVRGGRGEPGVFKVCGQLHRRIGNMLQQPGTNQPSCIQTYFLDPQYQAEMRASRYSAPGRTQNDHDMEVSIFRELQTMLTDTAQCNNPYIQSFLHIKEYIDREGLNAEEVQIELHATDRPTVGTHPGRYHLPTAPEVSLLMPTSLPRNAQRRVICNVRSPASTEHTLQFIPDFHRSYPALMYPMLNPTGMDGWTLGTRSLEAPYDEVSFAQHTRYFLITRSNMRNNIQKSRRLYQQYITDMWARQESMTMNWVRNNQTTIRADLYQGVVDNARRNNIQNSGRMTILPATITCSDRWYHKSYQNAMALVRARGKPTFFITQTMDIKCPEVRALLEPGQSPYDKPDILCRVFNLKRQKLLDLIVKEGIFGKCVAYVSVIEFQKRGAPHSHNLIWIEDFDNTPIGIDNIISAEIPDKGRPGSQQEKFHDMVVSKMMHGPCGLNYNMNLGCCKNSPNGTCQRKYPKDFKPATEIGERAFPDYRRRSPLDGGNVGEKWITRNGQRIKIKVDNRWVVPYSPYLLKKFGCHVNVEFCHTVASVKYLFLYHSKGEDLVTVDEIDMLNEVKAFQTRRYLSACYCYWRLAEMKMVKMKPSVKPLPLHLPGEQTVTYQPNNRSAQAAIASNAVTPLIGYFHANNNPELGELARATKYEDFPEKFVWHTDTKCWTRRQRDAEVPEQIGRMVSIHPNRGDLFFMRLILKHVQGKASFQDLRTVEGEVCPDFKTACVKLGLCEDDSQWVDCLNEAKLMRTPRAMRELFCNLLLNCHPTDSPALLQQFAEAMSEDYVYSRRNVLNMTADQIERVSYNDLLIGIDEYLELHGKTNSSFNLPLPDYSLQQQVAIEDQAEIDPDAQSFFDSNINLLNDEQRQLYERIVEAVDDDTGGLFNIDAPGGSGKTFVSDVILTYVRMKGHIAIATAMSGIAATLLKLGTTFHRRFGPPIPTFNDSCSNIKLNSKEAGIIRNAKLIMVDEVSMMNKDLLDLLDRLLRALMNKDEFMGGKLIVLMHDFRQILPVIPGGTRAHIVDALVINSEAWAQFTSIELTRNMRVERMIQLDPTPHRVARLNKHADWLLSVGNGTAKTVFQNLIEVPCQMVCQTQYDMEDKVYDDFLHNYNCVEYLEGRAIMSCTNDIIQECNFKMIEKLPGEMVLSTSVDSCIEENDKAIYDTDFLNRINASGIAPHRLAFKVGACIILIKNLNVRDGHCNGTRYIILEVTKHLIRARKLSGGSNAEILIPRIPMICKDTSFPVPFKRLQFPVLGAYYLTLNRAQGQSLKRAGMYLPRSVFAHGHTYVGFSRCGDPDSIFVYADQSEFENLKQHLEEGKVYMRNVVYPEVLTI